MCFVEVLERFKLIMKDSVYELVLGGDDGDDIISVLVLLILSDTLTLFNVEETSDFGEEYSEGDNNNTPSVVDDIPDVGDGFLNPDKLRTELNGDSFENSLEVLVVAVDCPVSFRG